MEVFGDGVCARFAFEELAGPEERGHGGECEVRSGSSHFRSLHARFLCLSICVDRERFGPRARAVCSIQTTLQVLLVRGC